MSRLLMERHKRRKRDGLKRDGLGSLIYMYIYIHEIIIILYLFPLKEHLIESIYIILMQQHSYMRFTVVGTLNTSNYCWGNLCGMILQH